MAEGIETEEHFDAAIGLGATLGQGWLLGRPGPLPDPLPKPAEGLRLLDHEPPSAARAPFDVLAADRPVRRARKRAVLAVSHHLERQAVDLGQGGLVLTSFESKEHFGELTQRRYAAMAEQTALVAALGAELGPEPAPGVRGTAIEDEDPALRDWTVVVVGHHFAGALASRDSEPGEADLDRVLSYIVTYDRELVLEAARFLISKILPVTVRALPGG